MNEQIKKLAEQARAWVNDTNNVSPDIEYVFYKDAYDKKFAELIVAECIDIISPYTVRMSKPGEEYLHPIQEIKQHFGVEE